MVLWKEIRSIGLGSCDTDDVLCCRWRGQIHSQLGSDLDPFCGCAVVVAAPRTKSQGLQDEGVLEREGRKVLGWEVLL